MRSLGRVALLLALVFPATHILFAQSTSSSSAQPPAQTQDQTGQTPSLNQQQMTVQERIRLRRAQRRAQAIHDTYAHVYEAYAAMGYMRFKPGPSLQRVTLYAWDLGFTRYYNLHLGVTVDGRGYYGTPYVGLNFTNITRPAISQYDMLLGPTYRFILHPRYSIAGRVMGGFAHGNFTGDTNGFGQICLSASSCLLYPDGYTYALTGEILGEYNLTPTVGLRLGGNNVVTGFGSAVQSGFGFTGGFVYRFGRQ